MSTETRQATGRGTGQSGQPGRPAWSEEEAPEIGDWLLFAPDGTVEVYCGKAEVGQGIRASLAQAVAEELRVGVERVRVVLGDTDLTPYDAGTFGSRTTPVLAARLHKVAASAREALVDRAAERWGVDRAELVAGGGRITHAATDRALDYAGLAAEGRLREEWRDDAPVTPAGRWKVAGRAVPKAEARALVTGRHRYTPDLSLPGMLAGVVLRAPGVNSRLIEADTSAAEELPGVTVVREGDFVGVTAPDAAAARRAAGAIRGQWEAGEQVRQEELFDYLKSHPSEPRPDQRFAGPMLSEAGSVEDGLAAASRMLEATYTVAYIAHAPLEPRAALAVWQGGRLTVWTGTQRPFGVRTELATAFGIEEEAVRVIVPDTGSAYGGKHTGDAAIEAARLARAAGRPVKVVWTREEEFTWAYYRPAGIVEVRSGVSAAGEITAWEYHNYNSGAAGIEPPYKIPNRRVAFHPSESPLRQGSYRALAATANHFARESHVDELAALLGVDPLAFRLQNLEDERLRAVLEAAAERFGWGARRPEPGRGFGIAGGTEKGGYVATCAEVEVDGGGQVRLVRVVEAFECGAIVNPEGLANQVEGAVVQAIGGALFEQIEFAQGKILSDRFSRYRVPRFGDVPEIETVLLDRKDLPSAGAGETPIVGLAPAVGNAIYAATGERLRSLPMAAGRRDVPGRSRSLRS